MTKDKALEIAIEWMEGLIQYLPSTKEHKATMSRYNKAITAIKETSAQRTWVGLTDEDRYEFAAAQYGWEELLIAAEAKLKDKNCVG